MTSAKLCSNLPAETTAISSSRASDSKLKLRVTRSPGASVMVLVMVLRPINEHFISWVPLSRLREYLPSISLETPLVPEVMYAPMTVWLSEEVIKPETVWAFDLKEWRKKTAKMSRHETLGIKSDFCIYRSKYIFEQLLILRR